MKELCQHRISQLGRKGIGKLFQTAVVNIRLVSLLIGQKCLQFLACLTMQIERDIRQTISNIRHYTFLDIKKGEGVSTQLSRRLCGVSASWPILWPHFSVFSETRHSTSPRQSDCPCEWNILWCLSVSFVFVPEQM